MYKRMSVALYFGPGCFARRDDPDGVAAALDINDHGNDQLHQSKCNPAILSKVFPTVRSGQHRMLENSDCIIEVDPVFADVATILYFVPFEFHPTICIYDCTYNIRS